MIMNPMQPIFGNNYLDKFKRNLEIRKETIALPVRPHGKKTRFFIDNEYFSERYGSVLPMSAFLVYGVLCKYANSKTQSCYPSVATIMKETCIRSAKTVFASLKKLEAYRIIEISHSKGRSSNKYILLDPKIWVKPAVPNPVIVSANSSTEYTPTV
jgi:hypothetical protein